MSEKYYVTKQEDVYDLSDLVAELFMEGKSKDNASVMSYANGVQDCLCNVYDTESYGWFVDRIKKTIEEVQADRIDKDGRVLAEDRPEVSVEEDATEPHDYINLMQYIMDCEKYGYKKGTEVVCTTRENTMCVTIIVDDATIDRYELDMDEPLSWKRFVQVTDAIRLQMFDYYIEGKDFDVSPQDARERIGRSVLDSLEGHAVFHPHDPIKEDGVTVVYRPAHIFGSPY